MKTILKGAAFVLSAAMTISAFPVSAEEKATQEILVTTTDELITALDEAEAGDEIILREGTYLNDDWLGEWAAFFSYGEGTAENPIILRSEDPENPAIISGTSQENKNALYIFGDYWIIKDLKVTNAQKGIMLDNSNYSIISGCEVYDIGTEAIHLRDNSSYCIVEDCYVHDTGTVKPEYGEGVYIGSAYSTEGYGYDCHYNTVRNCTFGPNIAADHVDIKEYTIGTLVENCTFDGTGMQGQNGGNSFIEIKGNNAVIRYNTGYRNGCEKLLYAFDANVQVDGWAQNNKIYDNTLYLDTADCLIFKEWMCSTQLCRNIAQPEDCTYSGNLTVNVLEYILDGDVNEEGSLNKEDILTMQNFLLNRDVVHISRNNSDMQTNDVLDSFDLCRVRKAVAESDGTESADMSVSYVKEDAGKWRMCDGLGDREVTFEITAKAGSTINMGWGCWDPNFVKDDGTTGKWITTSLGNIIPDENGNASITVELPTAATRAALEVWDYSDENGDLDADDVELVRVVTK